MYSISYLLEVKETMNYQNRKNVFNNGKNKAIKVSISSLKQNLTVVWISVSFLEQDHHLNEYVIVHI